MGDEHKRRGASPNDNASQVCREQISGGLTLDPGQSRVNLCRLERPEPAHSSDECGWMRKGQVVRDGYLLEENRRLHREGITAEFADASLLEDSEAGERSRGKEERSVERSRLPAVDATGRPADDFTDRPAER